MPEPPDFDLIADVIAYECGYTGRGHVTSMIAERLRQVWNARGAADRECVEHGWNAGLDIGAIGDAIGKLDR